MKHFVVFITIGCLLACHQNPPVLSQIKASQLQIDDSLPSYDSVETFLHPYSRRLNQVLDSALAYAPKKISKGDGEYNTTAGNLLADIMMSETRPIFKSRTGKDIDFVLFNHGGIRSILSKGKVSARNAYEVMPFENTVTVVALQGTSVRDLVSYLVRAKRAHPISGMQVVLNRDGSLKSASIQGKPIDGTRIYYIATSSYLVSGGDNMIFFREAIEVFETDYKIRNMLIDYFGKVDTLNPKIDNRFVRLK
ncbi:5'-nucleotidase C-terminal domain-containing protein [Ulvibacterium sp.]|uniref:5'-nucleotidase C-terminal domain-containing protein n=1 Tax=Ulvibacterium sp. TaxID=2665914 RepID=UPI0026199FCF|nr:5'-nucleotidase [Ulvibacterium sp.]